MIDVGADRHGIADGFVDGAGGHVVRVDVAVARTDPVRNDNALHGIQQRPDDGGIRRAVILRPDQRLDDGAALHFMIVLAHHRFLGADVQAGQHVF